MNKLMPVSAGPTEESEKPSLRELTETEVDRSLPVTLRIQRFVADILDPYHFAVSRTEVRVSFIGGSGIKTRLACALSNTDKQTDTQNPQSVLALSVLQESTVS